MNYFELHIGDYDSATAHLSAVEDGIYGRLLRLYYRRESPLPADVGQICRFVRASGKPEREIVETMLAEFFELREDGWHNVRADEEVARFQDKQRKAKASANARWGAQRAESDGNANADASAMRTHMRTHSDGNADGMHRAPVPTPQAPITSSVAKLPHRDAPVGAALRAEDLEAEGVAPQHARDWLAVRKTKRLPLTRTALERFRRDAERKGMSLPAAVEFCAGKGWAGFYVDAANGHADEALGAFK